LLDVNMLLALLDAAHVHHTRAKAWLLSQANPGWASCPITQNGFARVISQPSYPSPVTVSRAVSLLQSATESGFHEFWSDDLSLLDDTVIDHSLVHGPKQITDVYLLALALKHEGRLVALDRAIPLAAARGAQVRHLVLL
jgi:toxin-antitoxin system PIN domain toxin